MASLAYRGQLTGHNGWVTSIATSAENPNMLVSASRDRTVAQWSLTRMPEEYGVQKKGLHGHSHFVEDVVVSSDAQFALSGSWDSTLRLWDLNSGASVRNFVGHSKDVLSVAFSADNRQIVSGSRDRTIRLWNTLGLCKFVIREGGHSDWVSCVRFSPSAQTPLIVSAGWDKKVKVWSLQTCKLIHNLEGHTGYVNTVTVSPDGSLCASGGKDGVAMLWDVKEGKNLYSLEANSTINSLVFSPNRYWLCAASGSTVKIWDLETKGSVAELEVELPEGAGVESRKPTALSLAWSADGSTLFAGYSDNTIRVWNVSRQ